MKTYHAIWQSILLSLIAIIWATNAHAKTCAAKTFLGNKCTETITKKERYCKYHSEIKKIKTLKVGYTYEDILKRFIIEQTRLGYEAHQKRDLYGYTAKLRIINNLYKTYPNLVRSLVDTDRLTLAEHADWSVVDNRSSIEHDLDYSRYSADLEHYIRSRTALISRLPSRLDLIDECDAFIVTELERRIDKDYGYWVSEKKKAIEKTLSTLKEIYPDMPPKVISVIKKAKQLYFGFALSEPKSQITVNKDDNERIWHDKDGWMFKGILEVDTTPPVSENSVVNIFIPEENKSFECSIRLLSNEDVEHVKKAYYLKVVQGYVWTGERWGTEDEAQEYNYIQKAKNKLETIHAGAYNSYVFQPLSSGALCKIHDKLYYLKTKRTFCDNDKLNEVFYIVGTYTYQTVQNTINRIPMCVDNRDLAISMIRRKYSLHKEGDYRFSGYDTIYDISAIDQPSRNNPNKPGTTEKPPVGISCGSGFFITNDGYLITNHHVIKDGKTIEVSSLGQKHEATLIAQDERLDLALLKINTSSTPIPMCTELPITLGQEIMVMGFPRPDTQGLSHKLTRGIISSENGMLDDVNRYQIDASIQPGNSGGPVCDIRGRLVGVTVSGLNANYFLEHDGNLPQNVNYAIKRDVVTKFLKDKAFNGILNNETNLIGLSRSYEESIRLVKNCTVFIVVTH